MVLESSFFYFVLLTLLVAVVNALMTKFERRHDWHSRVKFWPRT